MAECYNKIYLKDKDITVSCGKCFNCIANMKYQYASRMIHEAQKTKINYFTTFTYDDIHVPIKNNKLTLNKKHATDLIKRINKEVKKTNGTWKYFSGWEYGEKTKRPHGHMVLLSNRPLLSYLRDDAWHYGKVQIQNMFTYKAISYTVGYTAKKIKAHEDKDIEKEFHKFSRGIGREWIHEAITTGKVSEKNYNLKTQTWTTALPAFYKKVIKEYETGYRTKYEKIKPETRKKYMYILENTNWYAKAKKYGNKILQEKYKIEEFLKLNTIKKHIDIETNIEISEVQKAERDIAWDIYKKEVLNNIPLEFEKREFQYLKNKYGKKNNKNETWDDYWEFDEERGWIIEKYRDELEEWYKSRNMLLKTEAENKYWRRKTRDIV